MAYTRPPLHDYQKAAKQVIMDHPRCGLFLDMGFGKAVPDDTLIPVPDGRWRPAGDLKVGDFVIDMNGEPQEIKAVFHHEQLAANRMTLSDGRSMLCCNDHLVPLWDPETRKVTAVKPLRQLYEDKSPLYLPPTPRVVCNDPHHQTTLTTGDYYRLGVITQLVCQPNPFLAGLGELEMHEIRLRYPVALESKEISYTSTAALKKLVTFTTTLTWASDFGLVYNAPTPPVRDDSWCIKQPDQPSSDPHCTEIWAFLSRIYTANAVTELLQNASLDARIAFIKGYLLTSEPTGDSSDCYHDIPAENRLYFSAYARRSFAQALLLQVARIAFGCGLDVHISDRDVYETRVSIGFNSSLPPRICSIEPLPGDGVPMTCFTVAGPTGTYLANDYIVTHNTLITLDALYDLNPHGHVLIVAPKNIARSTWIDEINKWQIPLRWRSLIVNEKGKDLSREKRLARYQEVLQTPPCLWFINRELLFDLIEHMPVVNGMPVWPFPNLIIDELQSFKNYKSVRFNALKRVMPAVDRFIGLTGTPTPNGLMDLWPEIYLMDAGRRLGKNITAYRHQFFRETLYVNNHPVRWEPLPGAEDEIYRRINDIVASVKNPNIKLPPVSTYPINIYMDDDEMKVYKKFLKDSVLNIDGTDVTAANAAVLKNKLAQMASGTIYLEQGKTDYKVIHTRKLDMTEYLINNASGSVLIAYHFKADLDQLLQRFPSAEVFDGSPAMITRWNNKQIPIMLIQPASAGHGLNIQFGGHTLIWYTLMPNLEEFLQTNARLARQGQPDPVVIYVLIADKTVDRGNWALLQAKDASQERLKDAVQMAIDVLKED